MASNDSAVVGSVARSAPQATGFWHEGSDSAAAAMGSGRRASGSAGHAADQEYGARHYALGTTLYPENNAARRWDESDRRRRKRTSTRRSLVHAASQGDLVQVVRIAERARGRDKNPVIETSRRDGSTALHVAAAFGQLEVCRWLIEEGGALINAQDRNGETPLYRAVAAGHAHLVAFLLESHADICLATYAGDYPPLLAAELGHRTMIERLLQTPEAVDLKDRAGDNCLARACLGQSLEVVDLLLRLYSHLAMDRNHSGRSPYDLAAVAFCEDICMRLSQGWTGQDWPCTMILQIAESSVQDLSKPPVDTPGELDRKHWKCVLPWRLQSPGTDLSRAPRWLRLISLDQTADGVEEAQLLAGEIPWSYRRASHHALSSTSPERLATDLERFVRAIEFIHGLAHQGNGTLALLDQYIHSRDLLSATLSERDGRLWEPEEAGSERTRSTTSRETQADVGEQSSAFANGQESPPVIDQFRQSSPRPIPRPYWQPDEEAANCLRCHRQFSFFIRRHHCRRCGLVVCDRCSSQRVVLDESEIVQDPTSLLIGLYHGESVLSSRTGPQRVCDECFGQVARPMPSPWSLQASASLPLGIDHFLSVPTSRASQQSVSNSTELGECPVCSAAMHHLAPAVREDHLRQCLEGDGARSKHLGGRYLVYRIPESSPIIGEECAICFIEFSEGEKAARLSCLCNYHQVCIEAWFATGHSCPVHVT